MYNVFDVANWFISKGDISPKKLQKLVYYAYAWYLTLMNDSDDELNNRLFEERAEAWIHGPVFPKLYRKYKEYGSEAIDSDVDVIEFNKDTEDVLSQVWEVYGEYNGNELESISHQEDPWIKAREGCFMYQASNRVIEDTDIFIYYSQRLG